MDGWLHSVMGTACNQIRYQYDRMLLELITLIWHVALRSDEILQLCIYVRMFLPPVEW
jgi:hypothetical protein